MNLKPLVIVLVLLPLVILNVILSIRGQEGLGFTIWGMFVTGAIWVNNIWMWMEIFKELKRRKVENENIL